jgi:hypothetical protein
VKVIDCLFGEPELIVVPESVHDQTVSLLGFTPVGSNGLERGEPLLETIVCVTLSVDERRRRCMGRRSFGVSFRFEVRRRAVAQR